MFATVSRVDHLHVGKCRVVSGKIYCCPGGVSSVYDSRKRCTTPLPCGSPAPNPGLKVPNNLRTRNFSGE